MIAITTEDYRRLAATLRERIGTAEWFNGSVTPAPGGGDALGEWRLVLTAIVRRRREELPEGVRHPIDDVVPVWWEFRTDDEPNDFSFAELRPYLIDYE